MSSNKNFGSIDIALSCTLFLEGALKRYKNYVLSVDADMLNVIKEWNRVLISLLKDGACKNSVGFLGNKLIKNTSACQDFVPRCVSGGRDVMVQSLHYALRFQENVQYLIDKFDFGKDLVLCDLGCGLSPLLIAFQNKYDLSDIYCIDIIPDIADLYTQACYKLNGKVPNFIDWGHAQKLADSGKLNTLNAVGCLPNMSIDKQKEYLTAINDKFPNFFVEIKYKKTENAPHSENAFSLQELRKMTMNVKNVSDMETAMIASCMRYLFRFAHAKPDRTQDFLVGKIRGLFLSR